MQARLGGPFFCPHPPETQPASVPLLLMPTVNLLSTQDLSDAGLQAILKDAMSFVPQLGHRHDLTVNLSGRNIALVFFEPSTRTRLSFETAAHRLGASTVVFHPTGSSVEKGESLRDTFATIDAMKFDAMILRHGTNGIHEDVARLISMPVISAGEGTRSHPTQGLLDASALLERLGTLQGARIAVVGDIRHSRVARSQIDVCRRLGAEIAICAPNEFLPDEGDPLLELPRIGSIDEALEWCSVISMLRIQKERILDGRIPDLEVYRGRYSLTTDRLEGAHNVVAIHPGPVNLGVEIDPDVLEHPRSLVHRQVTHGVAVRMAVILRLLTHHQSLF